MSAEITGPFVATEYIDKERWTEAAVWGQTGICSLTFIAIWDSTGQQSTLLNFSPARRQRMRSLREQ